MGSGGTSTIFTVKNDGSNTAVGKVFDEFGTKYWEELLRDAKKFCKEKFGEVKDHSTVTLVVVELQRGIPAVTVGDKIELSAHYIVEKKK